MNELAGQSLGGYLLEEELGRGSMGMVYRGKQVALSREVAIKILPQSLAQDPSYVARFIREAQIMAGLNHPNIVQIFDAGQQNGVLYFVMEYVQGPTIGSLLHLDGSMPQHLAAEYVAQIADALDAAYQERNVIHRDLKPENLMLDRWGRIKVMDFGLARAPGLQQITIAKTLVGSIYYASPEQIWGKPLDNRSDIYALGVVLYEMVTGQRPFSGRSLQELTQKITTGQALPPTALAPDLAPELEAIILIAMAAKRDERFAQASMLAAELRALQLRPSSGSTFYMQDKGSSAPAGEREHGDSGHRSVPKRPSLSSASHQQSGETPLTLPVRERQTPIPPGPDEASQKPPGSQRALSIYDTSPELPAQLHDPSQEEAHTPDPEQLEPVVIPEPEPESETESVEKQPRGWHRRKFKSS
ncbi:MAG TPA: serine/threonine-protein kinase [Ktedonobacteraceae bacterium]